MQDIIKPEDTELVVRKGRRVYMLADEARRTGFVLAIRHDIVKRMTHIDPHRDCIKIAMNIDFKDLALHHAYLPPGNSPDDYRPQIEYFMQAPENTIVSGDLHWYRNASMMTPLAEGMRAHRGLQGVPRANPAELRHLELVAEELASARGDMTCL